MSDFETRQAIRFLWIAVHMLNESLGSLERPEYFKILEELKISADHITNMVNQEEGR